MERVLEPVGGLIRAGEIFLRGPASPTAGGELRALLPAVFEIADRPQGAGS